MSMAIALGRIRTLVGPETLGRIGRWWLREFLGLFPTRVAERLSGRGRALLAVSVEHPGFTLELLNGMHVSIGSERLDQGRDLPTAIDQFLYDAGYDRADADIGLRLPEEQFFTRQLLLPAEAIGAIETVLAQDLTRKTPFRAEDVYSGHSAPEPIEGNKFRVWQWVVRRNYVDEALFVLGRALEGPAFIACDTSIEGQPAPFIDLHAGVLARDLWYRKVVLAMCVTAVGLALVASGVKYFRQQTVMDRLDERIASVSGKAQQIRMLADQAQEKKTALLHLRLQRSDRPGLIDLWEEMTRILPTDSWLTEFRVGEAGGSREDQVVISGFSTAAPRLVSIVDSSPLFFDAALTSPIAFDTAEGRDRFALQAKVKAQAPRKEAAR